MLLIWLALSVAIRRGAATAGAVRGIAAVFCAGVMILSMGLCVSLTSELLRGALSSRHAAEFVRTPKTGGQKQAMVQYRPVFDRLARVEVFIGLAYAVIAILLLRRGDYLTAPGFAGSDSARTAVGGRRQPARSLKRCRLQTVRRREAGYVKAAGLRALTKRSACMNAAAPIAATGFDGFCLLARLRPARTPAPDVRPGSTCHSGSNWSDTDSSLRSADTSAASAAA